VVNRTVITIRARVVNSGGITETNVRVNFWDSAAGGTPAILGSDTLPSIGPGLSAYAELNWRAVIENVGSLTESHAIMAEVEIGSFEPPGGGQPNTITETITVNEDRADLTITTATLVGLTEIPENTPFEINVTVDNNGLTTGRNFTVEAFDGIQTRSNSLGNLTVVSLIGGETVTVTLLIPGISGVGIHNFTVVVDPEFNQNDTFTVGGMTFDKYGRIEEYNENNNVFMLYNVPVVVPDLTIIINVPVPLTDSTPIEIGSRDYIDVGGNVVRTDSPTSGVQGISVTIEIVETGTSVTVMSEVGGLYSASLLAPDTAATYTIQVTATGATSASVQFEMVDPAPPLLPWWLIIIIILIIVAIIVGITLYLYFVGLGKTVQCGECGAYIPEGATKCPKCGVEFETEVAKCSVCNAWVPIDVKNCPECGTEFTVGMEELEDYETKMKRQYDQIVNKFRAEAKKELGDKITETEFQAWWATQATFITFDQWLKEEEEMKRMGSKPCPACGTDNSVTAKICHKCGTLMEEPELPKKKPPIRKEPAPATEPKAAPAAAPPAAAPPAAAPAAAAPAAAAPVAAAPAAAPAQKKKCPSCGMEVGVAEKMCPICNYDFEGKPPEEKPPAAPPAAPAEQPAAAPVRRVVKKPVKKVVRKPVKED
jgi:ribosomal protein L40E